MLFNSSFGHEVLDSSRHTVTVQLSNKKSHAALNSKLLEKLNYVINALYEVELTKAQIEQKQPFIVGFSNPSLRKTRNIGALIQLF